MTWFLERLKQAQAKLAAEQNLDPWRPCLERARGKIDFFDNLERISSQTLLDLLEVPQRNRLPQAPFGGCRKLWLNSAGPRCAYAT
jgi:hypothetical protein